jgi:antitoxin ParD1/3/4
MMTTMNLSLSDALKAFVDEQVNRHGYANCSEYVCELIRQDQERMRLRKLLMSGAASAPTVPADAGYFEDLRERVAGRS